MKKSTAKTLSAQEIQLTATMVARWSECTKAIPAIFKVAADEENWLIFGIGAPDEQGKRPKRPMARDRPYIPVNRNSAASFTLQAAIQRLKDFGEMFGSIEEINAKAAKWHAGRAKGDKPPGALMVFEGHTLGYFPREGSALITLDFDGCVKDGEITDPEVRGMIEATNAYVEISSSGSGLRVVMERAEGDERFHCGEKTVDGVGYGLGVCGKGNGFAITLDVFKNGSGRDQGLFEFVTGKLKAARDARGKGSDASIEDHVLEHGRVEVDQFLEMVKAVRNDVRFESIDEWIGMVRAAREYFEVVDPDRLDEIREAVEEWSESWQGGDHDPDKFEDVWERKARAGIKSSLGSWFKHARDDGWGNPRAAEVERFVLVKGKFYDTKDMERLDASQMYRISIDWKMPFRKKLAMSQNDRLAWLAQNLQQFEKVEFRPGEGKTLDDGILNSWRPIEAVGIARHPKLWLDLIAKQYPNDWETIVDWFAFVLQNPGKKVNWSPVLIGPPGSGKDSIVWPVVQALGAYAAASVAPSDLEDKFNGWAVNKILCVMQEASESRFMNKANIAEKLKTLIAAPPDKIMVREMRKDGYEVPNVLNLIFLVNKIDGLFIESNERRYFPVVTERIPDFVTFVHLWAWMKDAEGWRDLVAWLLQRRITRVTERDRAPISSGFKEVAKAGLPPGSDRVIEYLEGRNWFSLRQLKEQIVDLDQPFKMSDHNLNRVLVYLGYERWKRPDGKDHQGRWAVWIAGKAVQHVLYKKASHDALHADPEEIMETLKRSPEEVSRAQISLPLTPVSSKMIEQVVKV